ncbi:unnamed protein product [Camellia sinensis]
MGNAEVASAIIRSSILFIDAVHLAEQADVAIFSQAMHFSLVGLFSAYEAMVRHDKIIRAANKLKTISDRQNEKVKKLEFRLATSKGKVVEVEKKLQIMDSTLKSLAQEINGLKEDKEQLSSFLTTWKASLSDTVKATKDEGCKEAIDFYEEQFAKLENMLFEDGWTSALQAANVLVDSDLRKNIPFSRPDTLDKPSGKTGTGARVE